MERTQKPTSQKIDLLFQEPTEGKRTAKMATNAWKNNNQSGETAQIYQRVNDSKRFIASREHLTMGDCKIKSMETWFKMRKAGAVRRRGKRSHVENLDDPNSWHYWVENKGKCFDESGGVTQIMDTDLFYKISNMVMVCDPNCGAFFSDEFEMDGKPLPQYELRAFKHACEVVNETTTDALRTFITAQTEKEKALLEKDAECLADLRPEQLDRLAYHSEILHTVASSAV